MNLPQHYTRFKIEPIHFITENRLDWFQGNVVKYVCRHDAKNGIEDLKKARRYLDMYIKYLEGDPKWAELPGTTTHVFKDGLMTKFHDPRNQSGS